MLKHILPTISWLIANTIIYSIYKFYNLGSKLASLSREADLAELEFLQHKPLFWFYLIGNLLIIFVGIFDIRRRIKEEKEKYTQQKNKQRRNYRAH